MVAISFVRALKEKYMLQDDVSNHLVLPKDRVITTAITFVGFENVKNIQCRLSRLRTIDLSGRSIAVAGEVSEFADRLISVETLNLAHNCLIWSEVFKIVAHLPRLRELILTENNLADGLSDDIPQRLNRGLECLTLGRTLIEWTTLIRTLSIIWPFVEQIDQWDCSLNPGKLILKDPALDSYVSRIYALKLSQNKLTDMVWINQVGSLNALRELDLSRCSLMSIVLNANSVQQLKDLESLNISYNLINDWLSISELNKLPKLHQLMCQENPLYILDKFAKPFVIARLGGLKILNRETISVTRRRDSEILYVRKSHAEYKAFLNGDNTSFRSLNPRYEELVELYGMPADLSSQLPVDRHIQIHLCYGDQRITKELLCDMRIANVHMLCKRLFRLKPSSKIELTCVDPNSSDDSLRYRLDQNSQTLDFYSVKSGHELLIRELDK